MYRNLHSDGEKGERRVYKLWEEFEVVGSGMRRRCSDGSSLADCDVADGGGDGRIAELLFGASSAENEVLTELGGTEVGERYGWSNLNRK